MAGQSFSRLLARNQGELRERLRAQRNVDDAAGTLAGFFAWLTQEIVTEADADAGEEFDDPSTADVLRLRRREQLDQMQEALRAGFVGALRAIHPAARSAPPPGSGSPGGARDPRDPYGPGQHADRDQGRFLGIFPLPSFGAPPSRPPARPETPPAPKVGVDRLLAAMDGAFASADRVLEAAAPLPPTRVKMTWAEDRELMELCQDLLRARLADDGQLALNHIDRLRHWLPVKHGITVIEDWDEDDSHFRVAFSADPALTKPQVERPALVLSDGSAIVRRGEVLLPAPDSPVSEAAPVPAATSAFSAAALSPESTASLDASPVPPSPADEEPGDE